MDEPPFALVCGWHYPLLIIAKGGSFFTVSTLRLYSPTSVACGFLYEQKRPDQNRPGLRITPAYAGKREIQRMYREKVRAHPRVCGEKALLGTWRTDTKGSPPRMRGKGWTLQAATRGGRITPAHAGKSWPSRRHQRTLSDHPRVCGEKYDTPTGVISL